MRKSNQTPIKCEPVVFKGNGLTPEYQQATWSKTRETIYTEAAQMHDLLRAAKKNN